MSEIAPIDPSTLETFERAMRSESPTPVCELLQLCVRDAAQHCVALGQARSQGETAEVSNVISDLTAVSSALGAWRLHSLCRAVEELLATHCDSGALNLVSAVERECGEVLSQLSGLTTPAEST